MPYTPVIGRDTYNVDADGSGGFDPNNTSDYYSYAPKYGGYNSDRLPIYMNMNMDIKLSMPFFWDNWSAFIQVINALNWKNIEGYSYDDTYTKKREITTLPILPIFGIRAVF